MCRIYHDKLRYSQKPELELLEEIHKEYYEDVKNQEEMLKTAANQAIVKTAKNEKKMFSPMETYERKLEKENMVVPSTAGVEM